MTKATPDVPLTDEIDPLDTRLSNSLVRGTDGLTAIDKGNWLKMYIKAYPSGANTERALLEDQFSRNAKTSNANSAKKEATDSDKVINKFKNSHPTRRVLIVEHNEDLGRLWVRFLEQRGLSVELATSQKNAIAQMRFNEFDALVLELALPDGGAIAVSDYATYRYPEIPIITVTNTSFFTDESTYQLMPNARSLMRLPFAPDDLAALLEHVNTSSQEDEDEEKGVA